MSEVTALRHDRARTGSGAFVSPAHRRRYWITALSLLVAGLVFCAGILTWDNPLPFGTPGFWRIAESRVTSVVVILIVAVSQAMATVAFQTAANNRIITPSIMGFESLYVLTPTAPRK